jgi:ppGpp synthetase/RelA/SpoT-type nucleotidyltranferase
MFTREFEDRLARHYVDNLQGQVRSFTDSVAEAFRSDPVAAARVRPLVVSRVKTEESLRRKLRATYGADRNGDRVAGRGIPDVPLSPETLIEYVPDLGGVRVIVHDRADIDAMVAVLLRHVDEGTWRRCRTKVFAWSRDEREVAELAGSWDVVVEWSPRGSYRSRHIVVGRGPHSPIRCEVQFRSVLEEAIFEARHRLIYRVKQEGGQPPGETERVLEALTEMFTAADDLLSDTYQWRSRPQASPEDAGLEAG